MACAAGNVLIVDCGYQLAHLASDTVLVIEWEQEMAWRRVFDKPLSLCIYSNFGLLALDDRTRTQELQRIKTLPELTLVASLDLR